MNLSEDDLREIFGLFTSCSRYERNQIYSSGLHDYKTVNLLEEYDLSQEKREFSLDAWRSIIYFLHRRGYQLQKDGIAIGLDFVEQEFVD